MDDEAAARAFLAGTASIVPKRGGDQVEMIRLLKVAKDSVTDGRTRALNQVRSLLLTAPMAVRERLSGLSRNQVITTCASFRPGELVGPLAVAKRASRSLARRIQALDAELKELMADLDGLTQAACPGLRQSYGIGIDGAAVLLMAVGDNPERIRSDGGFRRHLRRQPPASKFRQLPASPAESGWQSPGQCHPASHRCGEAALA